METKFLNANIIGDPDMEVVAKALEQALKAEPASSWERKRMQGWLSDAKSKKMTVKQVTVIAQFLQATFNDYSHRATQYKEAVKTISNAV